MTAAPEHSQPGESQSSGLAERTIQSVKDLIRCHKATFESRIKRKLPMSHPIMRWLIEHVVLLLNKYQVGTDGRTAYGRLHGKEVRERICQFGEKILYFVPKQNRAPITLRWRYGVFLGRAMNADQNDIGLADGSVTQARAMVRLIPGVRWDVARVERIAGTPTALSTQALDTVEEALEPHDHVRPEDEKEGDDAVLEEVEGRRRLKIMRKDLEKHGYSPGCPKCRLTLAGDKDRARVGKHTEVCRKRIYDALRKDGAEKMRQAEHDHRTERLDPEEPRVKGDAKTKGPAKDQPVEDAVLGYAHDIPDATMREPEVIRTPDNGGDAVMPSPLNEDDDDVEVTAHDVDATEPPELIQNDCSDTESRLLDDDEMGAPDPLADDDSAMSAI